LHPAYLERPAGLDYAALLAPGAPPVAPFDRLELLDFTAVGPIVTLDLVGSWQTVLDGVPVAVDGWPMQLQALRAGPEYRALRLAPRSRSDSGQIVADGSYRHPDLKVTLQPSGEVLARTQDALTEMQVMVVRRSEAGTVAFKVLGYRAAPGQSDPARALLWLTGGAAALRPGAALSGPSTSAVGPPQARFAGQCREWLFGSGASWARERWIAVSAGLRHFLIVASAEAGSSVEAERLFTSADQWFQARSDGLCIE
jgi:hypothetical protein